VPGTIAAMVPLSEDGSGIGLKCNTPGLSDLT
jgi:hypothetical protein